MTTSLTRQSFQASAEQVRSYALDGAGRAPAFLTPLELLPHEESPALAELPVPRTAPVRPWPTITEALRHMAQGELSAAGLVDAALNQIQARGPQLNAFAYVAPAAELLEQAIRLDNERRRGQLRGPLHGIPVSVKDVIDVAGMPTGASSALLADAAPATADAVAVRRLREAGAIIIGKTHTHEFALGVTTPQSRNPHDETRDPGGSSGGSAISVATGMSVASLGTDTRASIRVPAALCGVVGYKPTFGLVPTGGVTTLSWSLDHVASMGQTVADVATMLGVTAGDDFSGALQKDVRGLHVGVPVGALEGCELEVRAAFEDALAALRSLGVEVSEVGEPDATDFDLAVSMGLIISRCEAAAYHRAFGDLEANREHYTRPVYEQLDEAGRISAADYLHAQRGRAIISERVLASMRRFDAMVTPTCLVTAPPSAEVERYFLVLSQNCILWSFVGVPALSLPCGRSSAGLPIGVQLAAMPFADRRLLALAAALESAL